MLDRIGEVLEVPQRQAARLGSLGDLWQVSQRRTGADQRGHVRAVQTEFGGEERLGAGVAGGLVLERVRHLGNQVRLCGLDRVLRRLQDGQGIGRRGVGVKQVSGVAQLLTQSPDTHTPRVIEQVFETKGFEQLFRKFFSVEVVGQLQPPVLELGQ